MRDAGGHWVWNCDAMGWIYCLPMLVDQHLIHPTIQFLDRGNMTSTAEVSRAKMRSIDGHTR